MTQHMDAAKSWADVALAEKRRADEAEAGATRAEEALRLRQSGAQHARQQAFLELAEELAAMSPEERDRHIRRIIDNAQEGRA